MESLQLPLNSSIESTPKLDLQPSQDIESSFLSIQNNLQTPLENTLNSLFPLKSEEDKVARMRSRLGETVKTLSDIQIEKIMAEFQYLIDTWLDEYERGVFEGMTLNEALNEK